MALPANFSTCSLASMLIATLLIMHEHVGCIVLSVCLQFAVKMVVGKEEEEEEEISAQ